MNRCNNDVNLVRLSTATSTFPFSCTNEAMKDE